jgi:hypothetical protein
MLSALVGTLTMAVKYTRLVTYRIQILAPAPYLKTMAIVITKIASGMT